MGNTFTRDTNDTINWNSLKTENLSNDNNYSSMSNDSKLLLNRLVLNIPKGGGNSEDMSDIDNIFSKPISNIKPLVGGSLVSESESEREKNNISDTSLFISSEMYNLLMKNNDINQNGGSIQKGGKIEGDDSSTSSTSSSNDSSDNSSSDEFEKKEKKKIKSKKNLKGNNKNLKGGKKVLLNSSNSNELSYISSSAHTGESESESNYLSKSETNQSETNQSESSKSESNQSESNQLKSIKSKGNQLKSIKSKATDSYESSSDNYVTTIKSNENSTIQNLNKNLPNSSINTSDINMITE